jgi:GDPmannose 4,6-dehydratase
MVTRKITRAAAGWVHGDRTKLKLGNIQARRDWGFAGDYVKAMHAMLQQEAPRDYVIGTGESHSVAEFIQLTIREVHRLLGERYRPVVIEDYVEHDPRLLRTGEIHDLRADATRARTELAWQPAMAFPDLVKSMVEADVQLAGGVPVASCMAHA